MTRNRKSKETMHLLYKQQGSNLWGILLFFRLDHESPKKVKPYRKSSPFVVAKYMQHAARPIVYGSLDFLLNEIKRLINEFNKTNETWWLSRQDSPEASSTEALDFEYDTHVMDFTILLATYARNLFHLIKRVNDTAIPKLNYDNKPDGDIRLTEVFDTLIHNRYYYFDGTRIRDIFSEQPARRSLADKFMGYGFDFEVFAKAIWDVVHDIELRDLTQLIRWKYKNLTIDSNPQDVVFLVQNVQSLSDLMKVEISSKDYNFMMDAMFSDAGLDRRDRTLQFQPPAIKLAEDLARKEFDIQFRYRRAPNRSTPSEDSARRHHMRVGYGGFLDQVNAAFGKQKLLSDFTTRKRHRRAKL